MSQSQARVYSYLRFSTPEQALGNSEQRQIEGARAYATKHKLQFDESLRMADRGISGFTGSNAKGGALGAFLETVKRGEVPSGSILCVENIDRLSRQGFRQAYKIIETLVDNGITIQTLSPEQTIDEKTVNGPTIHMLIGQMMMAHDESVKKSERVGAAWRNKKEEARTLGKIATRKAPAWLRIVDGGFVAIPEAVATIKRIFQMKLDGLGRRAIEKRLNSDAAWKPKKDGVILTFNGF